MARQIWEIWWLVKWRKRPSPILFCSKPACPSERNSDLLSPRPSDYSNPWCSHLVLHSPSVGTRKSFLWRMFLLNFSHVCVPYLINLSTHQNDLGKCFRSTDVRVALLLLTLSRKYKVMPRKSYFEKVVWMILLSVHPSFTPPHTTLLWEFLHWPYYEILEGKDSVQYFFLVFMWLHHLDFGKMNVQVRCMDGLNDWLMINWKG